MPFGRTTRKSPSGTATTSVLPDQVSALKRLAKLAQDASIHPNVRKAAMAMTRDCNARDDMCEIQAIFDAVKHGTDAILGMDRGLRYVRDPRYSDWFASPVKTLEMCSQGSCAGDCDDAASLLAALLAALGFLTGVRAWGHPSDPDFEHVYAVVAYPKNGARQKALGLDTTVDDSEVGWEPPGSNILTCWLE